MRGRRPFKTPDIFSQFRHSLYKLLFFSANANLFPVFYAEKGKLSARRLSNRGTKKRPDDDAGALNPYPVSCPVSV
jgi:hypothetical protein